MRIYVSGSLAYDRVMAFPGRFADHIQPDKAHILNISFLIHELAENLGGTAGNIAWNLVLMGEKPTVFSTLGRDARPYLLRFEKLGLDAAGVRVVEEVFTAGAYITTDQADNQITGFNPGAMKFPCGFGPEERAEGEALAIVSAGNVEDMVRLCQEYRSKRIRYILDPGQQLSVLTTPQLTHCLTGAYAVIGTDYEMELIQRYSRLPLEELVARTGVLITTLGEKGSMVLKNGKSTHIKVVPPTRVKDPTGSGDAYRAGLVKGLAMGLDVLDAARLGSVCASFCVEQLGTQEHRYDMADLEQRYTSVFGSAPFTA